VLVSARIKGARVGADCHPLACVVLPFCLLGFLLVSRFGLTSAAQCVREAVLVEEVSGMELFALVIPAAILAVAIGAFPKVAHGA
jgi:hypothetical protein